jgi:hypothetical protein
VKVIPEIIAAALRPLLIVGMLKKGKKKKKNFL